LKRQKHYRAGLLNGRQGVLSDCTIHRSSRAAKSRGSKRLLWEAVRIAATNSSDVLGRGFAAAGRSRMSAYDAEKRETGFLARSS
jgi:hypothetical protein